MTAILAAESLKSNFSLSGFDLEDMTWPIGS